MKVKELIEELLKVEDKEAEILVDCRHIDILVEYDSVEFYSDSNQKFIHIHT